MKFFARDRRVPERNTSIIRVLIATPLGQGGKGGIDRIVDQLRENLELFKQRQIILSFGTTRGPGPLIFAPFYLFIFTARMIFLKATGKLDVLHLNISQKGSSVRKIFLARLADTIGLPYVFHLHGSEYDSYYSSASPHKQRSIKSAFARSAMVVVLGKAWLNFVTLNLEVPKNKVKLVRNATSVKYLHTSIYSAPTQPVHILFLGELSKRKGLPQLIDALALLPSDLNWRATLAGNGNVAEIRSRIATLGLGNRVSIPGWLPPEATTTALMYSDILALPSFAENLPMSVIEAMAFGLAVIATPVGSIPEIIKDGETGVLIPQGEVGPLMLALSSLIRDQSVRQSIGHAAQKFYNANLTVDILVGKLAEVWKCATESKLDP